jgi:hypothetical protein
LFCVGVSDIALTAATRKLFNIVNALNIALAALLLLQTPVLVQFFTDHYSFGYEGMIPLHVIGRQTRTDFRQPLAGWILLLLAVLSHVSDFRNRPQQAKI